MTGDDVFTEHRGLLFSLAYEITGSVADSEDVLQESYLRWARADTDAVDNPRAYAAQIVTRQALNSLRSAQRRREDYVGPWLPEPILTAPDAAPGVELAEAVSTAMLLVLETLTPVERVVFVMREVFGFEYGRIADAVDRTESAVRQIAHRARAHVHAKQRRFTPAGAGTHPVVTPFLSAALPCDLEGFLSQLAPDRLHPANDAGMATLARVTVLSPITAATP